MIEKQEYQSDLQRAIAKAGKSMSVFVGVSPEGKMVCTINGYRLTAEEIIHLDFRGKLTESGVAEFARQYAEGNKS